MTSLLQSLSPGGSGGEDPLVEFGKDLSERGPELVQAVQAPANLAAAGAGAALIGGALLGSVKAAGPAANIAHRKLLADPGEVLVGYRKGMAGVRLPVYARLKDRLMHAQIIAPTGQAKTSLQEALARQDLKTGMTVFAIELLGDLRHKLLAQAFELDRRIYYLDPSVPGAMKWNPLAGPTREVARKAVSTFKHAAESGDEQFFKNFNSMVLEHSIRAVSTWAHADGREPTMAELHRFVMEKPFKKDVLGVSGDPDSKKGEAGVQVTADHLDEPNRRWWQEKFFGEWDHRQREQFTSGLQAVLDNLLSSPVVAEALTPEPGDPVLAFDNETLNSGGLISVCIPAETVGDDAAPVLATWVLMDFIQSVRRRGEDAPPISAYFDEVHNLLGHNNTDLAERFAGFITQARHYHLICQLSYQSFSLLPWELKTALESNTGTLLVSGRLGYSDGQEAIRQMGSREQQVKDKRRTFRGILAGPGTYSVGEREAEKPVVSEEELKYLSRGEWYLHRPVNGKLQRPVRVRAKRAPRPAVRFRVKPQTERYDGPQPGPPTGADEEPGPPDGRDEYEEETRLD